MPSDDSIMSMLGDSSPSAPQQSDPPADAAIETLRRDFEAVADNGPEGEDGPWAEGWEQRSSSAIWSELPEWVTHVAWDKDGSATAFETVPEIRGDVWCIWFIGKRWEDLPDLSGKWPGDWRQSLQERPKDLRTKHERESWEATCAGSQPTPPAESETPETDAWVKANGLHAHIPILEFVYYLERCARAADTERSEWQKRAEKLADIGEAFQQQLSTLQADRDQWAKKADYTSGQLFDLQAEHDKVVGERDADKNEILVKAQLLGSWSRQYHALEIERDRALADLAEAKAETDAFRNGLVEIGAALGFKGMSIQIPRFMHDEIVQLRAALILAKPLCDAAVNLHNNVGNIPQTKLIMAARAFAQASAGEGKKL